QGEAAPDRHDHLEQREGIAGRVPAPLLLPLHQVSRRRHHEPDRRRAFSQHQETPGGRSAADLLRGARSAGPEEEALDVGTAGLAETPAQRGYDPGNAEGARSEKADPAAARRAAEERAGRAFVRAAGVPE